MLSTKKNSHKKLSHALYKEKPWMANEVKINFDTVKPVQTTIRQPFL